MVAKGAILVTHLFLSFFLAFTLMKLRILGNTLRLRILKPELEQLHQGGTIEGFLQYGVRQEDGLHYHLAVGAQEETLQIQSLEKGFCVQISAAVVNEMVETERVGVVERISVADDHVVEVRVEKDFKCLDARPEDRFAFPHPKEGDSSVC